MTPGLILEVFVTERSAYHQVDPRSTLTHLHNTRGRDDAGTTLRRTDQTHSAYSPHMGRGSRLSSTSQSISPDKSRRNLQRLPDVDGVNEVVEQIEHPDGPFEQDQGGSDFELVDSPGHPPAKATDPSNVFTSGMAEGTRAGSARRSTAGSASPQRATTGHVDTKGKGKAVNHDIIAAPEPVFKLRPTRKSTGSTSPVKPSSAVENSDPKGKGKSPDRGYIEIDEHLTSGEQEYDRHPMPAIPTKRSVIPTSGLSHNVLMCCNTQVVWCVDLKGEKRRIKVRQVELHSDGIVLGDSNVKRSGLYISLSNLSGTEVRFCFGVASMRTDILELRTIGLSIHRTQREDEALEDQSRLRQIEELVAAWHNGEQPSPTNRR
jgi:hypothetical protein